MSSLFAKWTLHRASLASLLLLGLAACGSGPGGATTPPDPVATGDETPTDGASPQRAPSALLGPEFGRDARAVMGLMRGPGASLLAMTSTSPTLLSFPGTHGASDPGPRVLHRVEPDGTVSWSRALERERDDLGRAVWFARTGDAGVAFGKELESSLTLLDASGERVREVGLGGELGCMAPLGEGLAGIVGATGADATRWSWDGELASKRIAAPPGEPFPAGGYRACVADEGGNLWLATTNSDHLWKVGTDGAATRIDLGGRVSESLSARRGGGVTAVVWRGSQSALVDVDGAGRPLAPVKTAWAAGDGLVLGRIDGDPVAAWRDREPNASGRLLMTSGATGVAIRVSDDVHVYAAASTADGLWVGGELRGFMRVGGEELRSGASVDVRPFLLRVSDMAPFVGAAASVPQCAARSNACADCREREPACKAAECVEGPCSAASPVASDCACRAPEAFGACVAGVPGVDAHRSCFVACADACGVDRAR